MRAQFVAPEVQDASGSRGWATYVIEEAGGMWNVQRNGVTIQQWPREEFVLLDVVVCGVCSTDFALHRFPFPLPIVGGHEVVVSNGTQRFCVEINCSHAARGLPDADKCHFCNADSATPSQCPERRTVGIDTLLGGFAPVMLVPRFSLCPVPASVPTRLAVLAEPFAAALHAVRSVVAIPLDASVCVLGARKLGVMIVLALHCLRYSRVTAIGHSAAAVQVCSELGATTLLDGRGRTASFDVVFDCTGSPAGFDEATALAKTGGIVHVKSTGGKPVGVVSSMTAIVVDEIAILSQRPERAQPEWQWRVHGAWDAHDCLLVDAHSGGDGIAHSVVVVPSFDDVDRVHAAGLVLPRGAIVVTAPPAAEEGTCWNRVASKQLQVHTSRCGSIPDALTELDKCDEGVRDLLLTRYITHTFSLENFDAAFECARDDRTALKVLVEPPARQ